MSDEKTYDDLYEEAQKLDIQGRSAMTKDELERAISEEKDGATGDEEGTPGDEVVAEHADDAPDPEQVEADIAEESAKRPFAPSDPAVRTSRLPEGDGEDAPLIAGDHISGAEGRPVTSVEGGPVTADGDAEEELEELTDSEPEDEEEESS